MKRFLVAMVCGAALIGAGAARAQTVAPAAAAQEFASRLAMVRLYVRDMRRSERLLQEALGMRVVAEIDAREHVMMFPGQPTGPGLLILQANATTAEQNGAIVVRVGDVDAVLARAVSLGATIERPAQAGPVAGTRYAMFRDYDTTIVQITQYPDDAGR